MITFIYSTEKPPIGTFLCTIKDCYIGSRVKAKGTIGRVTQIGLRSESHVKIHFSGVLHEQDVYLVGDTDDRLRIAYKNEEKKYERNPRV